MKRLLIIVLISTGMMTFHGCTKCKRCTCWEGGVAETSVMCVSGIGGAKKQLESWEAQIRDDQHCDSVKCAYE